MCLYFWLTDLNNDKFEYFVYFVVFLMIGCLFYGITLGLFIATLVDDKRNLNAIIPIIVLPFFIVAGFFA